MPPEEGSATSPVREGDVIAGKYRVERVLGQGGMGIVVAARHTELGERVALKFLLPGALSKPQVVERFLREARAAVKIKSEHVARVSDVGRLPDGAPYMVMEFLEGRDLGQLLEERSSLPVAEAVGYMLQACEAIGEAHALGIIHRDLKPSNLFLTQRHGGAPLVKVLDFGIAKASFDDHDGQQAQGSLTQTAQLFGSPLYMSPEQIRSAKNVDVRSDIWSLGVVLFQLVTGRLPFDGESVHGLFAAIIADEPRTPSSLGLPLPEGLEPVLMRCLSKNPAERYEDVAAFADAIAPYTTTAARVSLSRIPRSSQPPSLGTVSTLAPISSSGGAAQGSSPLVASSAPGDLPRPGSRRALGIGLLAAVALGATALVATRTTTPPVQPATRSAAATGSSAAPPTTAQLPVVSPVSDVIFELAPADANVLHTKPVPGVQPRAPVVELQLGMLNAVGEAVDPVTLATTVLAACVASDTALRSWRYAVVRFVAWTLGLSGELPRVPARQA